MKDFEDLSSDGIRTVVHGVGHNFGQIVVGSVPPVPLLFLHCSGDAGAIKLKRKNSQAQTVCAPVFIRLATLYAPASFPRTVQRRTQRNGRNEAPAGMGLWPKL